MANLYTDFDLFITMDGIYLRLSCTDREMSTMENIDRYLTSSGIKVYDKTTLKEKLEAFESATFKICNAVVDVVHEHIAVSLSEDEMIAYVEFMPPSSNGRAITEEDIKTQLGEAGIVGGIKFNEIESIMENRSYFTKYEIAIGMEPIEGTPAFISYNFDTTASSEKKPKENADGSVDYYNMDIINPVSEGDLLATVEPAIPGIDGATVTGKVVPPEANLNDDLVIYGGRNVKLSEDKKQAYAATDGQVMLNDNRVIVEDVYFVKGDVDAKSGNIAFNGNVMVSGSVRAGFKIEATGDIQIDGTVEGAYIHSDRSILIKGGIQGMSKAYIYAGEDIRTKFIEYAQVVCHGSVETGAMLYCDLIAKDKVVLKDRMGMVIGGEIIAGREIVCKGVGSELGSMTILEVGRNPVLRNKSKELAEEISMLDKKRLNILKVIKFYKTKLAQGEQLDKEETQKLKELVSEQAKMSKTMELKKEQIELCDMIFKQDEDDKNDRIIVVNSLGQDVKLAVNGAVQITRQAYSSIRAIKHKGDLRIAYYSPEDEFLD